VVTTTQDRVASAAAELGRAGVRHRQSGQRDLSALLAQFPPRQRPDSWAAARLSRGQVLARLLAPPFALGNADFLGKARRGLSCMLGWLADHPGDTWQQRWIASGAEQQADWRLLPAAWAVRAKGRGKDYGRGKGDECSAGLTLMICADVIRPNPEWLLVTPAPQKLAVPMARARDPQAFSELTRLCQQLTASQGTRNVALARITMIMAAKGGRVPDITVGDCIEIHQLSDAAARRLGKGQYFRSTFFYQLLRSLGGFPAAAPPTTRAFNVRGQMSAEQMIDRYGIECTPIRGLLVDYLREFQTASDYSTVLALSYVLGKLFWRDLELHHPGISSLHLPPAVASAWKQRLAAKTVRTTGPDGQIAQAQAPRIAGHDNLVTVRSFYLDIAEWAADDPARWGPWVTVCPIREGELNSKKHASVRKSRMDQRTRERLPALPALAAAAEAGRMAAVQRLEAARAAAPGEAFTVAGRTLIRPLLRHSCGGRVWGADPATGRRCDLEAGERLAFWSWATVEVLRLTGIRIEELTELSHHSLIQYRLPATRELIPLLQIAPSKTDTERLLVVAPELADVLATIITRIRNPDGSVPLVVAYDPYERVWNPPMPLLFQWRHGLENRPIGPAGIRRGLEMALAAAGLTDSSGAPLRFTPHDFRRLFLTDAIMHGMPPHIAQLVAGHRDINTTMGYKAVYPEEVINGHRAFIARRRNLRPGEEYRTPTDAEWEEFLGHFERRRVALGDCGRSYSSPCIHEHSCLRCPLLRPSPAQRPRIAEIRGNLLDRIAEAEREGWAGEAEGLKVSLAGARHKLTQLDEMARRAATVHLGIPAFPDIAGRIIITSPSALASEENP
jgi:Phage integrase family